MEKRRRERTLEIIGETGVISIIRGIVGESAERAIDALVSGGVRCLEITMNTRGALDLIRAARGRHPDIAVGAGTVLSVADARKAIAAGADFVLAPTLSAPVIRYCNRRDALPVPGVFTPTELLDASLAGALLIKVFPAGSVGPGYIKDLLGPLDGMKLLPVGGITLENTADFMKAGAFAVGVGSSLANPRLAEEGNFAEIESRAARFIALAHKR